MALILVTGATGKLGRLVVRRLLDRGTSVRVLTRRPQEAAGLWGDRVDIATGDFADPASLSAAFAGVGTLFLLSPISEHLVTHQNAAIDAAKAAGLDRIVKVSGSDWTIANASRSVSGAAHAAVEAHLAESGIAHTVIRPNAWMQVSLAPVVAAAARNEDLPVRYDGAAVSYIDAEDIADVAVHALISVAAVAGPLILTGDEALTSRDVARITARVLKQPIGLSQAATAGLPAHLDAFERRAIGEFLVLIAEGQASSVTDTVERITGSPPRTVERYLASHLAALTSRSNRPKGEKAWH